MKPSAYDVIVIGAGAAGMMCAMRAGQRGKRVLLLDHAANPGPKILISGGGRCNFTNTCTAPDRFISSNPHFAISALKGYTSRDFIALVDKHKIPHHEKTLGQLFCDISSRDIIQMLVDECRDASVETRLSTTVSSIDKSDRFNVVANGQRLEASSLVLATGSLSIPKMGATGFTHDIARQFSVPVTRLRPGLVPLTFDKETLSLMQAMTGIAFEVEAICGKKSFTENMVFTHRGLSGPAILQISSYWSEGDTITLNLIPSKNAGHYLRERKGMRPKAELQTVIGELLPQRFAQRLTADFFKSEPMASLTDKYLQKVADTLEAWTLTPTGSEGYAKAEVTLGGVDTKALSSKTMEVLQVPGLYIIGEAVDVTGWLGGYNFQWAWSSGWAAGSAVP